MNITRGEKSFWDVDGDTPAPIIREAFDRAGFVVLRQAFSPADLSGYAQRLAAEFKRLETLRSSLPADCARSLDRDELPAHEDAARFRLSVENYAHLISSASLRHALYALWEADHVWHYPFQVRRMNPTHASGHLPYHQDSAYTLHYPHFLTCWIPLVDTGVHAPGLELVVAKVREKLGHNAQGRWEAKLAQKLPAEYEDAAVARPQTRLGDLIIFNELTLHKTFVGEGMTQLRYSMDARCIPRDSLTSELLDKRRFVSSGEAQFHAR